MNKNVLFGEIAETKFTINQPLVYRARFELDYLEAKYRKYDKSNVFGRVFSKRNSNVGKGYPEIFWRIELGDINRFSSSIKKNSHIAYAELSYFTVTDNTPIKITVWDYDALNKKTSFTGFSKIY